jgi:DNA-binding MarR family transcriptional regulator
MPPRNNREALVTEFSHSVGLLVRRVRAEGAQDQLSWTETTVMKRLAKDGPATTADLARAEGVKPQSMGTIVATLEDLEFVTRKPHPTDGRQMNIEITAKGLAAWKTSKDAKHTWMTQSIAKLTDEERATLFAAGEIMRRLAE